ncbi:flavodoxin domain-containing protein [[Clostridium] cellulosi]
MKTIIIYSTKYGCAGELAYLIQKELKGECKIVNVMKSSVPPLNDYDTVILGGSLYIGRIQKQLKKYVNEHLDTLLTKKVGLFLSAGDPKAAENEVVRKNVFPKAHAYKFDKMGFFDRFIVKRVAGLSENVTEYYENRIKAFAEALTR